MPGLTGAEHTLHSFQGICSCTGGRQGRRVQLSESTHLFFSEPLHPDSVLLQWPRQGIPPLCTATQHQQVEREAGAPIWC